MLPVLYIVVPCYKDEQTLYASVPVFLEKLESLISDGKVSADSRLVLINDGSPDRTWETILALREADGSRITGIDLAENCGEQNALIAGLTYARDRADCVVMIDSDLQEDIRALDRMLALYAEGNDVVLGVRNDRSSDGLLEKFCSRSFYAVMKIARTGLVDEHSNYRLLSKRAVEELLDGLPANYFLPCSASNLRLPRAEVSYARLKRVTGTSGYRLSGKLLLAKNAVFAHSAFPLKLVSLAGMIGFFVGVVFLVLSLVSRREGMYAYCFPISVLGFLFFALSMALRIVGEYIRKAIAEVRAPVKFRIGSVAEDP